MISTRRSFLITGALTLGAAATKRALGQAVNPNQDEMTALPELMQVLGRDDAMYLVKNKNGAKAAEISRDVRAAQPNLVGDALAVAVLNEYVTKTTTLERALPGKDTSGLTDDQKSQVVTAYVNFMKDQIAQRNASTGPSARDTVQVFSNPLAGLHHPKHDPNAAGNAPSKKLESMEKEAHTFISNYVKMTLKTAK